tara:strand:+ start:376 stop:852 length:477 start_codon:yes stop_codon:yes gene_type:complete
MSKTLEQIQEENRKIIICAVHGTDDYDEALEKDQKGLRKTLLDNLIMAYWCDRVWEAWQVGTMTEEDFSEIEEGDDGFEELVENLHKPLALNKVLFSFGERISITQAGDFFEALGIDEYGDIHTRPISIKWDLTKETLEEQSEETQRAINVLLKKGKQ